MKYSVKMTEAEYVATLRMVENIIVPLCKSLLQGRDIEPAHKEKDVEVGYRQKVREADNDDAQSVSVDYKVEWGSLDADVPAWLKPEEPPTFAQVGRGPVDTIPVPEDPSIATSTVAVTPAKAVSVDGKNLAVGRRVFNELVVLWLEGYKQEDAPQPDRAEATRIIANGRNAYKMLTYVKAVGGLTHAVNGALEEWSGGTEEERQALVLDVAGNMTQVASILFPDLSDLYEYKNIFQNEENDDE